ncbi:MAG: hypothetical protein R3C53_00370 [Pirellulaceae bacterium]
MIFFPVAFSLFVALRLSQAQRDDVRPTLSVLIIRLTVLLSFLFAFLSIGIRSSGLSSVWFLLLAVMSVIFWWKNRRLERSAMLLTVMSANDDQQRLSIARSFFENNVGFVRRRARALYRSLSTGCAWPLALEHSNISCSVNQSIASRLQWRYGQLPSAATDEWGAELNHADLQSPLYVEQEIERSLGRLMIFSWIVLSLPVLAGILFFVIPTLDVMLEEFAVQTPFALEFIVRLSDSVPTIGWTGLLGLGPLTFLALIGGGLAMWIFPSLTRLPVIRWMFSDYYHNVGFAALAKTASFEPDLIRACDATADVVPVAFIAERYRTAAAKMSGGMQPATALIACGLLNRREASAIGAELESHRISWGLQQLANYRVERMLRRISVTMQVLIVVVTILLAMIVGTIAFSLLQVLSELILKLSEITW